MKIDVHKEPEKDFTDPSVDEITEHLSMIDIIKSLSVVKESSKYWRTLSGEVVHYFHYCPGTHGGGGSCLKSELVLVSFELFFKKNKENPVKNLQEKAGQSNPPVVVGIIIVTTQPNFNLT